MSAFDLKPPRDPQLRALVESGTGWPSFTAPFDEGHLRRVRDTRYTKARCGTAEPARRDYSLMTCDSFVP